MMNEARANLYGYLLITIYLFVNASTLQLHDCLY